MNGCRFGRHEDKIVTGQRERRYDKTDVQPPSCIREIRDAQLVAAIGKSFTARDRSCGARCAGRDVPDEALVCGQRP